MLTNFQDNLQFMPVHRIHENPINVHSVTLREMCPNTELFLVRIFLYLD